MELFVVVVAVAAEVAADLPKIAKKHPTVGQY